MAGLSQTSLFTEGPSQASQSKVQNKTARQLWVAVCLLDLPFHSFSNLDADKPAAVVEPKGGQLRLSAVNAKAQALGIEPGMTISAALAFSDSLELLERSVEAERKNLEAIASWANKLTPTVSLQAAEGLLLEVQGSLKLFSGLEVIRRELIKELRRRQFSFRISTASTSLAAFWLARCKSINALTHNELTRHLAALPLQATGWPESVLVLMQEMGVRTIGECLRLSRSGFARRVGKQYLDELDKAMGNQPDFKPIFKNAETLDWTINFAAETVDQKVFIHALEVIAARLVTSLRQRQAQIRDIEVTFVHLKGVRTINHVELIEPVYEEQRILSPLLARLEDIKLDRPAIALMLTTGPLLPMQVDETELFSGVDGRRMEASEFALIECLQGRFGTQGVYGLELLPEHRPELVWNRKDTRQGSTRKTEYKLSPWAHERPLWILPEPLPLAEFRYEYALQKEPERIESGWWDNQDIRRDYYAVTTVSGERLWVYQDCMTHEWHLHGVFG